MSKTKQILEFIWNGRDQGRSFSEIQRFIVSLNGHNWDERDKDGQRRWRGYYCDRLLGGMYSHQGLLWTYCVKLPNGNWLLTEPLDGDYRLNRQTKTWEFNEQLKRGRWEQWRDQRGDPERLYRI